MPHLRVRVSSRGWPEVREGQLGHDPQDEVDRRLMDPRKILKAGTLIGDHAEDLAQNEGGDPVLVHRPV